ncbi:MAG: hypothetical protein RR489_04185 [Clostridia bacterium]
MKNKNGLSLIVLGITLIVLAILAGAVLLISPSKNPIKQATEKTYKADLSTLSEKLAEKVTNLENNSEDVEASSIYAFGKDAEVYIGKLPKKFKDRLGVEAGKLVVLEKTSAGKIIKADEKKWAKAAGYKVIPPYYNPPIPQGFTVVDEALGWNDGYTVKDSRANEYVWVPAMSLSGKYINGKQNKEYDQCFGVRDYTHLSEQLKMYPDLTKFTLSDKYSTVTDMNINYNGIKKNVANYGGFYISKYEIAVSSSVPSSRKYLNAYTSSASNLRSIAENADTRLGYPAQVVTMLPTSSHYDTIFAWLESSGSKNKQSIESSSKNWGNYKGSRIAFNTAEGAAMQTKAENNTRALPCGSNPLSYANNIADLAGNLAETTQGNLVGAAQIGYVSRGGSYQDSLTYKTAAVSITSPAGNGSCRIALAINNPDMPLVNANDEIE